MIARIVSFYQNEYCNFQPTFSASRRVLFFFLSFFLFSFSLQNRAPAAIYVVASPSACEKFTYTQQEVAVSRTTADARDFRLTTFSFHQNSHLINPYEKFARHIFLFLFPLFLFLLCTLFFPRSPRYYIQLCFK